ncbi:hypothetical protein HDU97_007195 [Phlyctochytrium planicorne]|nr:hypothetical protein HDU97_007195 [Phlyctochytrium planicorne]
MSSLRAAYQDRMSLPLIEVKRSTERIEAAPSEDAIFRPSAVDVENPCDEEPHANEDDEKEGVWREDCWEAKKAEKGVDEGKDEAEERMLLLERGFDVVDEKENDDGVLEDLNAWEKHRVERIF